MADEDLSLDDDNKETTDGNDDNAEGGSGGSKKKLIIIIAVAVVLLLGGGVAAYFLIFAESDEPETTITEVDGGTAEGAEGSGKVASEEKKPVVVEPPKGEAIYISIPDPFLVNIKSGNRSRMMQIKIQLLVRNKESEDMVKQHMPLIRNDLLDFFSLADADEVRTREGRNALKEGALETTKKVMKAQVGFEAIELVLFTGFVVQ